MATREDGEIVGKCRPFIGPQLLGIITASTLFACAQLAGLDDDPGAGQGAAPRPETEVSPTERANPPGAEKQADQNAQDLAVSQGEVEFGSVGCGTESKHTQLIVMNLSDTGRKFTVTIPDGAPFGIEGGGNEWIGELWAKGSAKVALFAKPSTSGPAKSSAVISSNGAFITVPLGVNGTGAELEWGTGLADVGETPLGMDGLLEVTLKNKGSLAAVVKKFDFETAGSPFSISPANLVVDPKGEAKLTIKLAKGNTVSGALTNKIIPDAFGQCAPPPSVQVTGQRVDTSVTVSGADFGRQPCNSTPADKKAVVIKNYYNKPVKWTLKTQPTRYTLASGSPTTGTVDAAAGTTPAQATILFSAPALGATLGALEDDVTITLENTAGSQLPPAALGDKKVKLRTDVRGAIVRVNESAFSFTATKGTSASNDLRVTNDGNETAKINWEYTRLTGAPAWTGLPGTTTTSGKATTSTRITYSPTNDASTAKLTPVRNGGYTICNPLPAMIQLNGQEPAPSQPPPDGGVIP